MRNSVTLLLIVLTKSKAVSLIHLSCLMTGFLAVMNFFSFTDIYPCILKTKKRKNEGGKELREFVSLIMCGMFPISH